jgi:predicted nucleic acid-binding protein
MDKLIIDTGFFVALLSSKDRYHKQAVILRPKLEKRQWWTTWPVITETVYLLSGQVPNCFRSIAFLVKEDALRLLDLREDHFDRMASLIHKYRDLPMDLADASLVILAEELGMGDIASTDMRDFQTYRFKNHKPFRNVLAP